MTISDVLRYAIAFICCVAGGTSFVNGILFFYDDRKLNRWLSSFLLILAGLSIISTGLWILGIEFFKLVLVTISFLQGVIGIVSIFLIREYRVQRMVEMQKRELKKTEET